MSIISIFNLGSRRTDNIIHFLSNLNQSVLSRASRSLIALSCLRTGRCSTCSHPAVPYGEAVPGPSYQLRPGAWEPVWPPPEFNKEYVRADNELQVTSWGGGGQSRHGYGTVNEIEVCTRSPGAGQGWAGYTTLVVND